MNLVFNLSLLKERVLPKPKVPHIKTNEHVINSEEILKAFRI